MKQIKEPLVSIICIAFNQEKFIAQTIESFLMQKTDFAFEVIIHDDASTDKTAEIVRSYADANPGIFRPIYEKVNQYTTAGDVFVVDMFKQARGKYIAVCEGDDFWTDPYKLQKQVDLMEKHPDYALCFHPVRVFYENNDREDSIYPEVRPGIRFDLKNLLRHNFIQTNTVMYRRQDYKGMQAHLVPQDWYLHLYHAQFGKIGFINEVMAAYRRHAGGAWWQSDKKVELIWRKHGLEHFRMYVELLKMYGAKARYAEVIYFNMATAFKVLHNVDRQYADTMVEKMVTTFPHEVAGFLVAQMNWLDTERKDHANSVRELQATIDQKDWHLARKDEEIEMIKSSKFWRFRNIVAKLIGRAAV